MRTTLFGLALGLALGNPVTAAAGCDREAWDDGLHATTGVVSSVDLEQRELRFEERMFPVDEEVASLASVSPGDIVRLRHRCLAQRETVQSIEVRWSQEEEDDD